MQAPAKGTKITLWREENSKDPTYGWVVWLRYQRTYPLLESSDALGQVSINLIASELAAFSFVNPKL